MKAQPIPILRHIPLCIVCVAVVGYCIFFSFLSVQRIYLLWASYFDLGIMHQAVFNTYRALVTGDISRVLELTDPHGSGLQLYRIAIHNDSLLAFLAPWYVLHSGPETLVIAQTLVLASGALALYYIVTSLLSRHVSSSVDVGLSDVLRVLIPLSYLAYYPLQRVNLYEVHAVAFSTGFILWMYVAYLWRRWWLCILFGLLAILGKEQVGISIGMFAGVELVMMLWAQIRVSHITMDAVRRYLTQPATQLLVMVCIVAVCYSLLSVFVIIPSFRVGATEHFALHYFTADGSSTFELANMYFFRLLSQDSFQYVVRILAPVLFLPLLSAYSIPALPDLLINLLSQNAHMRNTYFHYTALLIPWIFIALAHVWTRIVSSHRYILSRILLVSFVTATVVSMVYWGPFSATTDPVHALWESHTPYNDDIRYWQNVTGDDFVAVSTTGKLAPYFSGRRYFYDFGEHYQKARYVIVQPDDMQTYWNKHDLHKQYANLRANSSYHLVYKHANFEVYERISQE